MGYNISLEENGSSVVSELMFYWKAQLKTLKAFIKPFEVPQRSVKIKI